MNRIAAIDQATKRLCMLQAQALTLADDGAAPFLRLNGTMRSNFFWAMETALEELIELAGHIIKPAANDGVLERRLRAMRAQCFLLMSEEADATDRLTVELFEDLITGLVDNLEFCHELVVELAPDPRSMVIEVVK